MAMNNEKIEKYGNELYEALKANTAMDPISSREPDSTIEDAYAIQHHFLKRRMEDDKSTIIGKKIGVTSKVVMDMLGVHQPDFGYLLSDMIYSDGDVIDVPLTAAITAANVIEKMGDTVDLLPSSLYGSEDLYLYV
ncbi:MAG: hypothetical protein ACPG9K_07610, partial [Poseidonibacter sp.]